MAMGTCLAQPRVSRFLLRHSKRGKRIGVTGIPQQSAGLGQPAPATSSSLRAGGFRACKEEMTSVRCRIYTDTSCIIQVL